MLKNPQDRRAKRTATQIKQTMLSFMELRPIHEIRVSEICKACQINRATFYDHYRDVFDLVQEMELDMLLSVQGLMDAALPEDTAPEQVSRLFFDFLAENRHSMRLLVSSERSREFCIRLDGLLMPFFEKKVRQTYAVPEGMEPYLQQIMYFVSAGYYRCFMRALLEPSVNIQQEAELCARLSNACLGERFARKL